MDRIGEQARLVLEQTEKDEDVAYTNSSISNELIKNVDIEIDDEQEEDLEVYKVKIEPTLDETQVIDSANDLLNKLCINEEMKEDCEAKT